MTITTTRNLSFSLSIFLHLLLLFIFYLIKINIEYPPTEFVEIGFGTSGTLGASGAVGTLLEESERAANSEDTEQSTKNDENVKEVTLPIAKNSFENEISATSKKDDKKISEDKTGTKNENAISKTSSDSKGNKSTGDGSFGFDIDWGGKGKRRIYSYSLPAYPPGVNKEIDIRLRFAILADGTVGTIFPLTKADTQLENAAINSLRQWKFEPLPKNQAQGEQTAVIVFPYRLQ
jgi:protein TonB